MEQEEQHDGVMTGKVIAAAEIDGKRAIFMVCLLAMLMGEGGAGRKGQMVRWLDG